MAKQVIVLDTRPQAEKDAQAERQTVLAGLTEIETVLGELNKASFDLLTTPQKIEIVRRGLVVGLRGVRWLLRRS
jgi:hypothetical protein